jgi:DNA (cytosine-5)-methyltransferase 1
MRLKQEDIYRFIESTHPEFLNSEEAGAAISHFAELPYIKPALMPDEIFNSVRASFNLNGNHENPEFRFIDLFAGIGGFRQAMTELGGTCVFTSEWDANAQKTYEHNYRVKPYGDITKISEDQIPDHDVLCAGFPCQPFSLAGVSKKNSLGRKHGFEDETQGTLFFDIVRILNYKRPKAFFLENVKNLKRHDKGNTYAVIEKTLHELGYVFKSNIVDGVNWVPQHRERIFIVGFDPEQVDISEDDIYIPEHPSDPNYIRRELTSIIQKSVDPKYTLGPGTWATLERHKAHHAKAGNGFGYGILNVPIQPGTHTRTISARYHKDGAEILVEQPGKRPRRLTVEEAMQLQGYDPATFSFPVSNTQAYRQIGNSVVVPAVKETAKMIIKTLETREKTNARLDLQGEAVLEHVSNQR